MVFLKLLLWKLTALPPLSFNPKLALNSPSLLHNHPSRWAQTERACKGDMGWEILVNEEIPKKNAKISRIFERILLKVSYNYQARLFV